MNSYIPSNWLPASRKLKQRPCPEHIKFEESLLEGQLTSISFQVKIVDKKRKLLTSLTRPSFIATSTIACSRNNITITLKE